tara:strand:+ start:508 stop:717 length:210 start_codon:yes stop_codon:yes gene_type:complete
MQKIILKINKGEEMEEQKQLEDIKKGLELIKPYLTKEEYNKLKNKLIDEFITNNINAYRHQLRLLTKGE